MIEGEVENIPSNFNYSDSELEKPEIDYEIWNVANGDKFSK